MAVDLRRLVIGLQGEPFRRDVSSVTLDQLSDQQRLQLLSDVLAEYEGAAPNQGPDIHYETQAQTVERIMISLGKLKFDPSSIHGADASEFSSRLVKGEQYLVFKTLEFLVCNNIEKLRQRAYLSKFMVKLEVPTEFRADPDVAQLYDQYLAHIKEFQAVHKESMSAKKGLDESSGSNLKDEMGGNDTQKDAETIREGLSNLTTEKKNLETRLSILRTKVQEALQHERESEKFTFAVKRLRTELLHSSQIRQQINRERGEVSQLDHQLQVGGLRTEFERSKENADKSGLQILENLENEWQMLNFNKEKVSNLISQKRAEIGHLQSIARQDNFPKSELYNLQDSLNSERVNFGQLKDRETELKKSQKKTNNSALQLLRNQANAVTMKKDALDKSINEKKSRLNDIKRNITEVSKAIEEEKETLEHLNVSEESVLKLKSELKSRHDIYKKKRSEKNTRSSKLDNLNENISKISVEKDQLTITASKLEKEYGVPGFITKLAEQLAKDNGEIDLSQEQTPNRNETDQLKIVKNKLENALSNHIDATEIATIMEKASRLLNDKKNHLKPKNDHVREMKKELNKLSSEKLEHKVAYDALIEQQETTAAALKSNVNSLRRAVAQEAERYYKLDTRLITVETQLNRCNDENLVGEYLKNLEDEGIELKNKNRDYKKTLKNVSDQPSDQNRAEAWGNLLSIFKAKEQAVAEAAS